MDIPVCSLYFLSVFRFQMCYLSLWWGSTMTGPQGSFWMMVIIAFFFCWRLRGTFISCKPFCLNNELLAKNWRTAFLILRNCSLHLLAACIAPPFLRSHLHIASWHMGSCHFFWSLKVWRLTGLGFAKDATIPSPTPLERWQCFFPKTEISESFSKKKAKHLYPYHLTQRFWVRISRCFLSTSFQIVECLED